MQKGLERHVSLKSLSVLNLHKSWQDIIITQFRRMISHLKSFFSRNFRLLYATRAVKLSQIRSCWWWQDCSLLQLDLKVFTLRMQTALQVLTGIFLSYPYVCS